MALLEIKDLKTHFFTHRGIIKAVDGVTLSVGKGESIGIVGESGCGKSVTALSVLGLIPDPPGKIVNGEILLNSEKDSVPLDLSKLKEKNLRTIRGRRIAMIFQEPMTALNPIFTIGDQISEAFKAHQQMTKRDAVDKGVDLLKLVGISAPEKRYKSYPYEMSGGMRQRVMIAMALALNPEILIADEPTTALDVTIQAQILELIAELKERLGMALILITHDMGVIAESVKKVAVMYSGKIVELSGVDEIFLNPLHPYTKGLLKAIPPLKKQPKGSRLPTIPGIVPDLVDLPKGCYFKDRCSFAEKDCGVRMPKLEEVSPGHFVRCYHHG